MNWCAAFSYTGKDLLEISRTLKVLPNVILYNTNFGKLPPINQELNAISSHLIQILEPNPSILTYKFHIIPNSILTLHGWTPSIPNDLLNYVNIYKEFKDYDEGVSSIICLNDNKNMEKMKISKGNQSADDIIESVDKQMLRLWNIFLNKKILNKNSY